MPKNRRPKFFSTTTACHRGYVGEWEIADGKLLLTGIQCALQQEGRVFDAHIAVALPWLKPPATATWFTGYLRCPEGRLLDYVHTAAFGSMYDRDRLFVVERGVVKGEWIRLNPPSPILYRIEADGRRTCVDSMRPNAEALDDPLGEDEELAGYKVWGKPPEGEEGYVLGGYYRYPLPENSEL